MFVRSAMSRGCHRSMCLPVVLLSTVLLYHLAASEPKSVNCRRWVFHPTCRGVAAKRTYPPESPAVFLVDSGRKEDSNLEDVLGLYPTPQPQSQSQNRAEQQRPNLRMQQPLAPWSAHGDGFKGASVYEWYLGRKRSRDNDVMYDY